MPSTTTDSDMTEQAPKITRETILKHLQVAEGMCAVGDPSPEELALLEIYRLALQALDMQPRPLREITGRVAVIERLDRKTDEPYHIIVHKHIDGRWREAGADISCGHFDDSEPAIPLKTLAEYKEPRT